MDEVAEAIEKYQGLVPLVYDIETMGLAEARPEDMQYAVYLKREADKVFAEKNEEIRRLKRALYKACRNWFRNQSCAMRQFDLEARAKKFDRAEERIIAKAEECK